MVTLVISGDKGYGPYDATSSADIFDATGATVRVNNSGDPIAQTGWRVRGDHAPNDNAIWIGGEVVSDNNPQEEWTAVHTNDGPGFFMGDAHNFKITHLKMTDVFDGMRCTDSTNNFWADGVWIIRHRDDFIEADNRAAIVQVKVTRCYNQLGSGHFISSRRGNQAVGATPHVRIEIEDCLIEMVDIFRDTREKNQFAWSPVGTEKCRSFWKTESTGTNTTVLLKNNIIRTDCLYMSSKSTHALVEVNSALDSASGGNILVWRGGASAIGGIPMVTVPKIGGGTMVIPATILGITDGTSDNSNSLRIKSIFTFTDSETVWTNAVSAWTTNVWGNPDTDPPDEEPPPPPPPPPPPVEPVGTIVPHEVAWELASGGILVTFEVANTSVKQGIISKDHQGFGDGHLTFYLENSVVTVRHQLLPDVNLTLDVSGIAPNTEYELLFTFDGGSPGSTELYLNRALVAEQPVGWSLVGNTEPLLLGGNADGSAPGEAEGTDPLQGSVDSIQFLTTAEVDDLLGVVTPPPATTSAINISVPPLSGTVDAATVAKTSWIVDWLPASRNRLVDAGCTAWKSVKLS